MGDPLELPFGGRRQLDPGVQLLLGEQSGLDALRELDLFTGVQQRDLADLLEVILHRVGGGAGRGDLNCRRVVFIVIGEHESFGHRGRRGLLTGRVGLRRVSGLALGRLSLALRRLAVQHLDIGLAVGGVGVVSQLDVDVDVIGELRLGDVDRREIVLHLRQV
jgi:hypothetical protein